MGGVGFNCGGERGEGGGEPVIKLFGGGYFGGEGTHQPPRVFSRVGKFVSSHQGLRRGELGEGGCNERRIGTWSKLVDRRDVASPQCKAGNM